jgi:hypothetical protein
LWGRVHPRATPPTLLCSHRSSVLDTMNHLPMNLSTIIASIPSPGGKCTHRARNDGDTSAEDVAAMRESMSLCAAGQPAGAQERSQQRWQSAGS